MGLPKGPPIGFHTVSGQKKRSIRKYTDLPILVGFGVSTKKDVIQIGKFADGAVVGSALLDVIKRSPKESQEENARMFVKNLMPSGS